MTRRVPIFDGHNDALLRLYRHGGTDPAQSFFEGKQKAQLDLPKAREGGFAGGLFAIFVPPERPDGAAKQPEKQDNGGLKLSSAPVDLTQAQKAVFAMASLLFRLESTSQGAMRICRNVADIEACMDADALAAVLHIEGAEAIDENFDALHVLQQAGLRSLGPVWSRPNAFGHGVPLTCPASPDIGPGLTDLGKALIRACNQLKILIDLSHLNERGFWDVAAISDAPLVATHSNAHALSPHARNLTDRQLAAIRETGGMVGINFAVGFLREDGGWDSNTPTDLVIKHVDYLLEHVGEDNVGFGSDFDGAKMPAGLSNAAKLQTLVDLMRDRGFGEALIEKLCFRNWLRVLRKTWASAASAQRP